MDTERTNDWATEVTGYIERTVANVRDRTVKPAHTATRYLVYGLIAVFMVATLLVLLATVTFRAVVLLANALPAPHDNAWIAWIALGGMFCAIGAFLWSRRGSLS